MQEIAKAHDYKITLQDLRVKRGRPPKKKWAAAMNKRLL
jgi:hypothetical protein